MTNAEIKRVLDRWESLLADFDADGLAELYSADCKVTSPMFGDLRGRTAVAEAFHRLFATFPDWKVTVVQQIIDGDHAASVFSGTATHVGEFMGLSGSGRKAQLQGVRVYSFADGLITEELRLYDFTLMLIQLGVLRAKPGH